MERRQGREYADERGVCRGNHRGPTRCAMRRGAVHEDWRVPLLDPVVRIEDRRVNDRAEALTGRICGIGRNQRIDEDLVPFQHLVDGDRPFRLLRRFGRRRDEEGIPTTENGPRTSETGFIGSPSLPFFPRPIFAGDTIPAAPPDTPILSRHGLEVLTIALRFSSELFRPHERATEAPFEFGPFSLDPGKRLLLRNGAAVPLAPKVLETLLALVEHRDRVLSKDELLDQVWGGASVEEGGWPGTSLFSGRRLERSPTTIDSSSPCPVAAIGSWPGVRERR